MSPSQLNGWKKTTAFYRQLLGNDLEHATLQVVAVRLVDLLDLALAELD